MTLPIQLISTDFDGTLFAEFENPPIPEELQRLIAELQSRGAKWVINTGRDMSSLMEALAASRISVQPDYLVLVEREIHFMTVFVMSACANGIPSCARAPRRIVRARAAGSAAPDRMDQRPLLMPRFMRTPIRHSA